MIRIRYYRSLTAECSWLVGMFKAGLTEGSSAECVVTGACFSVGQNVEVVGQSYRMEGLKKFTEYSLRVLAVNRHGPGLSDIDMLITTLSDGKTRPAAQLSSGRLCLRNHKPVITSRTLWIFLKRRVWFVSVRKCFRHNECSVCFDAKLV